MLYKFRVATYFNLPGKFIWNRGYRFLINDNPPYYVRVDCDYDSTCPFVRYISFAKKRQLITWYRYYTYYTINGIYFNVFKNYNVI